jgi:hypothetical protein
VFCICLPCKELPLFSNADGKDTAVILPAKSLLKIISEELVKTNVSTLLQESLYRIKKPSRYKREGLDK